MLHSPGHSPRQLSTPTPSTSSHQKTLTLNSPNPNPRKRGPSVLDEDSYVAAIEKIIERDFFPDIPKLRDRLDWLEAVRSGDPVLIRDAQLKIIERRSRNPNKTPSATGNRTRSVTRTPAFSVTPSATNPTPSIPNRPDPNDDNPTEDVDVNLTLDEFFRKYTSEDNESFSKIMEKVNLRRKEKYAHLLEADKQKTLTLEDEKRDRITDGFGTSGQPPSTLEGWNYTAKNLLMYNPSDRIEIPLTDEERAERLKALTKEINRSSTRFHGNSAEESKPLKEEEAVSIFYAPVPGTTPVGSFLDREAERGRKYDLEDLRKTPNPFFVESNKKSDNGYSYLKTPSPGPGPDESPFMTWGEIEGTPLRLDLEESSGGPHFRIPLPPTRDVKAHSLSRDAARNLRERSRMFQKPPPVRGGSVSPSVRNLSPAAQKFMRNAIAKCSSSVDETLRASYRGASPVVGTPKERTELTRFSRDERLGSRSPSTGQRSATPW